MTAITDGEFAQFQRFIYEAAGITLARTKKSLVAGRLSRRLQHCGVASYAEYLKLLTSGAAAAELQTAVDLLTTNETYFFREPKHFEFLRQELAKPRRRAVQYRAWSAAGSTGEEAYSIAMVLEDCLPGQPWEVLASDISTRVLARARAGHYSLQRTSHVPPAYLKRFCLKGQGAQHGTLLVERWLRSKVRFLHVNLNARLPQLGTFDVVFLRNVLIYFDAETKRKVVERIANAIKPGGLLLIGHSETLTGIYDALETVSPSIYRKGE